MRILIDIPREFEQHFQNDRFEDSLHRLSADAHLLAGNYEQETAIMLLQALKNAVHVPTTRVRLIDADAFAAEMKKRQDEAEKWLREAKDKETAIRADAVLSFLCEVKLTLEKATAVDAATAVMQIGMTDYILEQGSGGACVAHAHGRWVWDADGVDWGIGEWVCSACGVGPETWWCAQEDVNPYRFSGSRYCPNCGARMDEEVKK